MENGKCRYVGVGVSFSGVRPLRERFSVGHTRQLLLRLHQRLFQTSLPIVANLQWGAEKREGVGRAPGRVVKA